MRVEDNPARIISKTIIRDGEEVIIDDPFTVLSENRRLCSVLTELVNNSLDQGAKEVTVKVRKGFITVRDDVRREDVELILERVNKRCSPRELRQRTTKKGVGGVGIWSSREILDKKFGGSLVYRGTKDGRVIAVATFQLNIA